MKGNSQKVDCLVDFQVEWPLVGISQNVDAGIIVMSLQLQE